MSYGKPVSLLDFRGGYNTRTPYELVKINESIKLENAQWRDGLIQRGGHRIYATGFAASDVVVGVSSRFYTNNAWYTILAVDEDIAGLVRFWSLTGTTLARLSASVEWTAATAVIFAELGGKIVAVNGTDDTLVIYYSGGWVLETLDEHDLRTRDLVYWSAGQYTEIGDVYTDDTTDAQDAGAADFQLATTTNDDGFFIACDQTFNKVILDTAEQAGGAPVAQYLYFTDDGAWKVCTMIQTPTWTDAAGDRTIEFDYPLDMGRWTGTESFMANKFVLLVRFTTAPASAFSCTSAAVYHSQWITQITSDTKPHYVVAHNDRMWLAVGYIFYFSPPNDIVGWRGLSESEYFLDGGPTIRSAVSFQGYLCVLKDNALYVFYGTEVDSFLRRKLFDVGVEAILTPVATEDGEMCFLAPDGIRMFNGPTRCVPCTDHIKDDISGWTWSDAVAIRYDGEYWISFPTDEKVLTVDPSTLQIDEDTGDGKAAFFKFTGIPVDYWINCDGKDDTKFLLAVVNASTPYIARIDNGTADEFSSGVDTAIDYDIQTNHMSPGSYGNIKSYGIFIAKLKETTVVTNYQLTFFADEGARSRTITVTVPAGTGYFQKEMTRLPWQMDGRSLSLRVRNNSITDAGFRGLSFEYQKKRF